MYSEVDDARETGNSFQLNASSENDFTDGADVAEVRAISDNDDAPTTPSNSGGRCDLASKPTAVPLSSRASAFSIAALMKDRETNTSAAAPSSGQRQSDSEGRHATSGSLYDIAADQWRQQDRDYSASGELVKTKTDADYWLTFSNISQRRTYIRHMYIYPTNTSTKYAIL